MFFRSVNSSRLGDSSGDIVTVVMIAVVVAVVAVVLAACGSNALVIAEVEW